MRIFIGCKIPRHLIRDVFEAFDDLFFLKKTDADGRECPSGFLAIVGVEMNESPGLGNAEVRPDDSDFRASNVGVPEFKPRLQVRSEGNYFYFLIFKEIQEVLRGRLHIRRDEDFSAGGFGRSYEIFL